MRLLPLLLLPIAVYALVVKKDELTSTSMPHYSDPTYCTCDPMSMWLDIIFVVDSSKAMEDVSDVLGIIRSILYAIDLINTRVGIVTYATEVQKNYDLGSITNYDIVDSIKLPNLNEEGENVADAMTMVEEMFEENDTNRTHVRRVMVIIASSYNPESENDPPRVASQFKESGGLIMTIEYVQPGQIVIPSFLKLASPGYSINTKNSSEWDGHFLIQAFCDMNCFCMSGQKVYSFDEKRLTPYGGCYYPVTAKAVYRAANINCKEMAGNSPHLIKGIVATAHDTNKQFFLMSLISGSKTPYWIGYLYNGTTWNWADNFVDNTWTNWDSYQPDTSGNKYCTYSVQTTGFQSRWYTAGCQDLSKAFFEYICQLRPCDSTYLCF